MLDRAQSRAPEAAASTESAYRSLPSIDSLKRFVREETDTKLVDHVLVATLQQFLSTERVAIANGVAPTPTEIRRRALDAVAAIERSRLRPILNATGVIIHTNLGRSPVSAETAAAMSDVAGNHVALEIEPETNERGGRLREISLLMRLLTGAEKTIVVNNNAAAVLLVLSAIAAGRSVILSRGEAVEIGGGFRVPDVMRQSGATLVEIGTTNRTYARDYAAAIDERTAALLKVHPSNFRVSGFVHQASIAELVEVARPHGLPVIEDLGSGALIDTTQFGLDREPTIGAQLAAGADVVTASGDKLLGGPQAGLIAGSAALIDRIAAHPLARAVRADKTCLAGIAATLRHYARGEAEIEIPIWRAIATSAADIFERCRAVTAELGGQKIAAEIVSCESTIGGGALPGQTLPSHAIALAASNAFGADLIASRLRMGDPAVFGRIENDVVLLDLRTVYSDQDKELISAVATALASGQ